MPILLCGTLTYRFTYDAPYWDEWSYVEPVARAFEGTLTPADFWVRINEHIQFVSSLIVIPLAWLTRWNMRYETGLTLICFIGTFGLVARFVARAAHIRRDGGSRWFLPVMALLMFSPSQYAVWHWGLHASIAAAVFFIVSTLVLLAGRTLRKRSVGAAIVTGFAATFSVGGGFAVWPAGAVAISARSDLGATRKTAVLAAWLTAGLAACAVFLLAGGAPADVGGERVDLFDYAMYVCAYLGGPLAPYSGPVAFVCGGVFAVVLGWFVQMFKRGDADRFDGFVFGLMSVGITAGVLTAFKHTPEGPANAISSRFLPWSTLTWCGVLAGLYRESPRLSSAPRYMQFAVIVAVAAVLAGWGFGAYEADERYDAFMLGREALLAGPAGENIRFLHPDPDVVAELRPLLVEHRLTVFREGP